MSDMRGSAAAQRLPRRSAGLAKDGRSNLFVLFRPQKVALLLEIRLDRSDETQAQLDASGLTADYDERWHHYRIRLDKADLTKHKDLLVALMDEARGTNE